MLSTQFSTPKDVAKGGGPVSMPPIKIRISLYRSPMRKTQRLSNAPVRVREYIVL